MAEVVGLKPCTLPPCPPYEPHPHYCRPCHWCMGSRYAQYRRCILCKGNGRLVETPL